MNQLIETQQQPATMTASNAVFNVQALGQLTSFANLMADSAISVPAHFVGKPADCMAVVMQAMQWGMNPYAVAQKTHVINGVLGYEAQLVNAVISSSNAIRGRFHYEYGGDWSKCAKTKEVTREKTGKNGKYTVTERVKAWSDEDEEGLYIRVGAVLRGEDEVTWGEPIYLSGVVIRNSPLWVSNPKQQIAYLAVKFWGRLYCPEVILGVYTPDEVEQRTEREINPTPRPARMSIGEMSASNAPESHDETGQQDAADSTADLEEVEAHYLEEIATAETCEKAKEIRLELDSKKKELGSKLFTALKGNAVARYYYLDSKHAIEAAINSLDVSEPDAKEKFEAAEKLIKSRQRHLGKELYDGFMLTMDDIRPEFQ